MDFKTTSDNGQVPKAVECERSLIVTCLLDPKAIDEAAEHVSPQHFWSDGARCLYSAILESVTRGCAGDVAAISEIMRERGDLEKIGGSSWIAELVNRWPASPNVVHHAKVIRGKAALRKMMATCGQIISDCKTSKDVDQIINDAQAQVLAINPELSSSRWRSYRQLAEIMPDQWEKVAKHGGISGVQSGISTLDYRLGGFHPGALNIIAARPGMGKTTLALNITEGAARTGVPVAFFSHEMPDEQLYSRQTAKVSGVDLKRFFTGPINKQQWGAIVRAQGVLWDMPVYINDSSGLHFTEIQRQARQLKKRKDIGLVLVDYLQIVKGDGGKQRKDLEITSVAEGLKTLAKELRIPVVALSQLSRDVDRRTNKRPVLSDLRESGGIEQAADVIMFIYRDDYYTGDKSSEPGVAEIIIGKNRNGRTGKVKLAWRGAQQSFDPMESPT